MSAAVVVGCCALIVAGLAVWVLVAAALTTWCNRGDDGEPPR